MLGLIGPVGPLEIAIVLFIVLVIWGPRRLPELGQSLGSGMRNFKDSITGGDDDDDDDDRAAIEQAQTPVAVPPEPPAEPAPVPVEPADDAESRPAGPGAAGS